MKIRKLTIHNIASIGDATIDFTSAPLNDAALFLITGDTGAGKSIILDSICLALYGSTPRLEGTSMQGDVSEGKNKIKINDPRQLLRRGTGEGWTELEFIGGDGEAYKARWSVARARTKADGKLQAADRLLTRLSDGYCLEKKKEIDAEIVRITGLDFEQFCRTTMLAQGEFTRFLNSNDKDKATILEKLTGVDIYSRIGRQIFNATKLAENDYELAKAKLENITLLSDEQLSALQSRVAELTTHLQQLQTRLGFKQNLKNILDQLNQARKDVNSTAAELPNLQSQTRLLQQYLTGLQLRLPLLQQEANAAELAFKANEAEVREMTAKVNAQTAVVEGFGLKQLNDRRTELATRLTLCGNVMPRVEALALAEQALTDKRTKLTKYTDGLNGLIADLKPLDEREIAAKVAADKAQADLDAQSDTINKFAQNMRAKLMVGQECPVCRQRIVQALPSEAELQQLVAVATANRDRTRNEHNNCGTDLKLLQGRIKDGTDICKNLQSEIDNDRTVPTARKQLSDACTAVDIPADCADIPAAVAATRSRAEQEQIELNGRIAQADAALKLKDELTKALLSLQRAQTKLHRTATDAAAKARSMADEINSQSVLIDALAAEVMLDQAEVEAIEIQPGKSLSQVVNDLQLRVNSWQQRKATAAAAVKRLQRQLDELLPPGDGQAEPLPTLQQLDAQINEISNEIKAGSSESGAISNQLETDRKNRSLLLGLQADRDAKYKTWQLHKALSAMFGSADGDKFRKIALSYVLGHLVRQANSYLRGLTDRYILKVEPGQFVITLEDAYQGYETRTAATLSGGESFMVSLALALALSDIAATLRVDVLFIDEGFGTLSGDALNRAIDTLRSLQRRAGRRVGIISHVAELRENIDTQIQVDRPAGTSLATVSVV